jgi:chorismate mutase
LTESVESAEFNKKTLKALRGAVCAVNTEEAIQAGTIKLYDGLLKANGLAETDLVSLFFSVTPDLDTLNPAAALRQSGRAGELAMMVFQEAVVQGGLPGTIRVLVHCYMEADAPVRHVYLEGAELLRPDWAAGRI